MTVPSLRTTLRTAGTGALLALLVTAGATAATAHDDLLDSSPGAGEHLDVPPTHVTLDFSDDLLIIGPAVVVADESETDWAAGEPVVDGSVVTVPVADDVPGGTYEVRWRVVSSDGHPISGVIPFTIADTVPDEPSAVAAPPSATPDPTPSAAPTTEEATDTTATYPGWVRPVLIRSAGALVAMILLWVARRLARRRATHTPGSEHT